jgi:hypothetical protein
VFGAEGGSVNYPLLEMTGTLNCKGAEGVIEGTDPDSGGSEASAITADMNNKCVRP